MGLPKHRRLRLPKEFRHVLSTGRRARDGMVAVAAARRNPPDLPTRFGFSVSRRVGGAVTRNRVKRQLRAIVRNAPVVEGWDIVVTAFPPAAGSGAGELGASVAKLSQRIGVADAGASAASGETADDGDAAGRGSASARRGRRGRRRLRVTPGADSGADPNGAPRDG